MWTAWESVTASCIVFKTAFSRSEVRWPCTEPVAASVQCRLVALAEYDVSRRDYCLRYGRASRGSQYSNVSLTVSAIHSIAAETGEVIHVVIDGGGILYAI